MQSLQMALSVSVPLLIYMAVGAFMRTHGVFSREQFTALNGLSFRTFLPMILFCNVYSGDFKTLLDPPLFLFVLIGTLSTCVGFFLLSRIVSDIPANRATVTQGCFRSNFLLFGTIIAQALCGPGGVTLVLALSALVVMMYNILSVILFEACRGGRVSPRHVIVSMLKNPILVAGFAGIFFAVTGIRLPEMVMTALNGMANAATPVALITLGGVLSFESMREHRKMLVFTAMSRLIVIPLIMLLIAVIVFGFRGDRIVALLAVYASPTAVASAPTAQAMGGNGPLASEIVAVTSAGCIVTIFVFVFTLSSLGIL